MAQVIFGQEEGEHQSSWISTGFGLSQLDPVSHIGE